MTRCSVCNHPDINEINEKLVSGVSPKALAEPYDLNFMALYRHKDKHLPQVLVKAKALKEESAADDLLERVEEIYSKAWELITKAEADGKYQPAVSALKEARAALELTGKLIGELKTGHTYNLIYNPEFIQVRHQIYDALLPYPEAREAVVMALDGEVIDVDHSEID